MRNSTPLVTVGIPNYNYAHFITEALNSVAAQTYREIELIIVDDCSTDNSVEVIESWIRNYKGTFRIIFLQNNKNLGLSGSCNVILNNSHGEYLQLLDSDDIIFPSKILRQIEVFNTSTNVAVVYSNVQVVNENGIVTNPDYCNRIGYDRNNMPEGNVKEQLLYFNFITVHSALFKTRYAKEIGGFDESLTLQDYYMWLQLSEKHDFKFLNECTGWYRIHEHSMSNNVRTNPASVDSAITLKYRYYAASKGPMKKKIAKNIQFGSVYLYQNRYPTSKKWLSIAFKLNPGFKPFIYYCSVRLGIAFSFFENLKRIIRR
ncbi:MAG: glycosyltransferase family 2 protein [Ginsengibacter sp.]